MSLRALPHAVASVALLGLGTTACGGAEGSSSDSPVAGQSSLAGGSSTAGAGGTSGSNETGGAASSGSAGQSANAKAGHGYVVLAHQAGEIGHVELRTSFDRGPAATCPTVGTYGSCKLTLCAETETPVAAAPLSAGSVSATSAPVALEVTATPDPQAGGGYRSVQQPLTGDFKGGENVTFAATGEDVPAFSLDLKMLAPPVLTKPASAEPRVPVARGRVELEWQPGETGTEVSLVAFGSGAGWTNLACTWDAAMGSGSVPADALKPLPNGQELFITGRRDDVRNAGNFEIESSLLTSARSANDTRARVLVLTDSL